MEDNPKYLSMDPKSITSHQSQFKLPILDQNNIKVLNLANRKSARRILHLPNIHNNKYNSSQRQVHYTQQVEIPLNQQHDTFALEVEEKLKTLLNKNQSNHENFIEDDDFEEKINQNKQIIKNFKLRKQNEQQAPTVQMKKYQKKNNQEKKNRNESLYEKKPKQYKEPLYQNKLLQKKKEVLKFKQIDSKNKQIEKSKRHSPNPKQNYSKILQKKASNPNLPSSQFLFDNIQNFLENPRVKRQSLIHLSQRSSKVQLQAKLSILQGNSNPYSPKVDHVIESNHQNGYGDWRKIQFKNQKIGIKSSNFDYQLQRINDYQQRSEYSLQRYLDNQKILLELQLQKRYKPKEKK